MSDIIETTKESGIFFANPAEMAMRDQGKQGAKCCEFFCFCVTVAVAAAADDDNHSVDHFGFCG